MDCLDDATISLLVNNELPPRKRAEAMAHVEQCASCDARLQAAVFGENEPTAHDGPVVELASASAGMDLVGTKLGRYMLIEQIGMGALGVVFAAYDPELDRLIAIKVLRRQLTDDDRELQGDLRQEARLMAKLSHPNVVPVFDVGIADGRLFIAMELIKGQTLREWARSGDHPWAEVRDVYHKAGRGLAAVHAAGLVYRDFKPSNIMLGEDGQVRVLDFGIAHAMVSPATTSLPGRSNVTSASGGVGTPGYMAPEQYSQNEKIDARADQYAFCVSLYEALHGNRPFGGRRRDVVRKNTLEQVWSEPKRNPGLPAWFRSAILRGLSLDPKERWPDMPSLLDALVKDKRSRRMQITGLLAAVAGTAVVTSVAMALLGGELEPAERDRIEQLTIDARAAAARTHFVYPPATAPDEPTAYSLVLELEQTEGDAAETATDRATELRQEFGDTLVGLGDRYYEKEGGRPFAMDYYAGALVFVPDNEHAAARVRMTPGELAALRMRAEERDFSSLELEAAESLVALAEPDQQARSRKLAMVQQQVEQRALSTNVQMAQLLGEFDRLEARSPRPAPKARPEEPRPEASTAEGTPPDDSDEVELVIDDTDAPASTRPSSPSSSSNDAQNSRDPAKSAAIVKEAQAAFASNRLKQAETLYHRALEFDSRNGLALSGLSELYFERGRYRQSLKFAKRAVARAPEQGQLRILLGDAHFKVLEYAEARRHYDKARALGHPSATKRLAKLERTVGNQ